MCFHIEAIYQLVGLEYFPFSCVCLEKIKMPKMDGPKEGENENVPHVPVKGDNAPICKKDRKSH